MQTTTIVYDKIIGMQLSPLGASVAFSCGSTHQVSLGPTDDIKTGDIVAFDAWGSLWKKVT